MIGIDEDENGEGEAGVRDSDGKLKQERECFITSVLTQIENLQRVLFLCGCSELSMSQEQMWGRMKSLHTL